jgi:hypothetical protein
MVKYDCYFAKGWPEGSPTLDDIIVIIKRQGINQIKPQLFKRVKASSEARKWLGLSGV